ncbi:uncharacterized protein LOC129772863 [Toxorhynchites rutilus septentrionalis]|uniref:uncharacterized protein LOC129772863 n=1 Tax=Toxorhynchites rutilus septentrionalis TaxID=329112 RepID=UPI00247A4D6B|nr:uncharacterized protein LOC129772863 [Toxorhynchites rutilus septentrionalis]
MDSPYPFGSVEPYLIGSCHSRSGPVFDNGDKAVQPVPSGKYQNFPNRSTPDSLLDFSNTLLNRQASRISAQYASTPGRNETGHMETPNSAVVLALCVRSEKGSSTLLSLRLNQLSRQRVRLSTHHAINQRQKRCGSTCS